MEKFSQELLSLDRFLLRVGRFALRAAGIFLLGIVPGIVGFMMTEGLSFAESALNAVSTPCMDFTCRRYFSSRWAC